MGRVPGDMSVVTVHGVLASVLGGHLFDSHVFDWVISWCVR